MQFKNYISLGVLLCMLSCGFKNDKLKEVDEWLKQKHLKKKFDGSVTIGNKYGIVYSTSLGVAERGWGIPISSNTRFDIASLNKSFAAHMIMQLVEANKLKLTDRLSDHLTYSAYGDSITIHQMLTHTAGLPDYDQLPDSLKANQFEAAKRMHFETDDYIEFISRLPRVGRPGNKFHYSNFAYHLLCIIIEKKEKKHFSEALDSMICEPLGLKDTFAPRDNYTIYDRVASSYQLRDGKFQKSQFIDYSLGRRIFSTSEDLFRWGQEMASPTLLSQESTTQILSNHLSEINPNISYGYGWVVFDGKGDYQMGRMEIKGNYFVHGGATDGYRSILVVHNDGEWIVSLLGNTGRNVDELGTAEHLLRILTN